MYAKNDEYVQAKYIDVQIYPKMLRPRPFPLLRMFYGQPPTCS
jgi:hypothetical protein